MKCDDGCWKAIQAVANMLDQSTLVLIILVVIFSVVVVKMTPHITSAVVKIYETRKRYAHEHAKLKMKIAERRDKAQARAKRRAATNRSRGKQL